MILVLVLIVATLVGCSSVSSPTASPQTQTSVRQAVCEQHGGLWHTDIESCEFQSPRR